MDILIGKKVEVTTTIAVAAARYTVYTGVVTDSLTWALVLDDELYILKDHIISIRVK